MDDWLLALLLKPFFAVLFFFFVFCLARVIRRLMPDGKLKRILFSPLPGHRERR